MISLLAHFMQIPVCLSVCIVQWRNQTRQSGKIICISSSTDLELITAIFPLYCNFVHTCLSQAAINCLQLVQNAAARPLTTIAVGPTLPVASIHWLPIRFRIDQKVLLITYKAMHVPTFSYISDLLIPQSTSWPLQPWILCLLSISCSNCTLRVVASVSFGPNPWNHIPLSIRVAESLDFFLKTHIFISISALCLGLFCSVCLSLFLQQLSFTYLITVRP